MKYPDVERTAVVTGASTGIGRATARMLKARGWRVWPTVRGRTDYELIMLLKSIIILKLNLMDNYQLSMNRWRRPENFLQISSVGSMSLFMQMSKKTASLPRSAKTKFCMYSVFI